MRGSTSKKDSILTRMGSDKFVSSTKVGFLVTHQGYLLGYHVCSPTESRCHLGAAVCGSPQVVENSALQRLATVQRDRSTARVFFIVIVVVSRL